MTANENASSESRTAAEAGWHVSRYNLMAPIPGTRKVAIANLYKGNCAEYTPIEMFLLSVIFSSTTARSGTSPTRSCLPPTRTSADTR